MPELPEVEVTKRGIEPILLNGVIKKFIIHNSKMREPVSAEFNDLHDLKVLNIERRAKYIVVYTDQGSFLIHLGMSGHLRKIERDEFLDKKSLQKHDHIEIVMSNESVIRFNDQRRFGLFVWFPKGVDPLQSKWIINLGPEPLTDNFNGKILHNALHNKKTPIKKALMDNSVVVGVGNIYASEVLFLTKINPFKKASELNLTECENLANAIKTTLLKSIDMGGTTIKDFSRVDGKLGYFVQNLQVYGHANEPCKECGTIIKSIVIGGRNTYFCPKCQSVLDVDYK